MGGTFGNPITEADQANIDETIQDVIKMFSVQFTASYTQVVIEGCIEEVNKSKDSKLKLEDAPIPSGFLKCGMLIKRGDVNKNWRNRFFAVYNKSDNYKIEYFDGTSISGTLKGTIQCAGYRASEFSSAEESEFGDKGITLVPWSWRRRTWYIKCTDDILRKEWLDTFQYACYKSVAPHDPDQAIASAFDMTLQKLRAHYSFYGYYCDAGSEDERLGEFILDLLDRNIINAIIGNIAEGAAKAMTVDIIRKALGSSVKAACSSAWISCQSTVRQLSVSIKSSVKELITPIIEKQNHFKDQITTKVNKTIDPFLADKASSVMKPVLDVLISPIVESFVLMAKGFHAHISSKIKTGEFSSMQMEASLIQCVSQIDYWYGPLEKANDFLYKLYTNGMTSIVDYFSSGITPYRIYWMIKDKLHLLGHRAVYTFGKLGKSAPESKLNFILTSVTAYLLHDALIVIKSLVLEIFTALLDGPITELVLNPAGELVAPLQGMIDSIPIPGLSVLLDLNKMTADVVGEIEEKAIDVVISKSVDTVRDKLNTAQTEIGMSSVNL